MPRLNIPKKASSVKNLLTVNVNEFSVNEKRPAQKLTQGRDQSADARAGTGRDGPTVRIPQRL